MDIASLVSAEACQQADREDPLAPRRAQFNLPEDLSYLVGHSLGPSTPAALDRLDTTAHSAWKQGLIRSWNEAGWIDLAQSVGEKIAKLISAQKGEVIVCDSVSTNLFKLAAAALPLAKSQTLIVEEDEFPTDQYIAEGLARMSGADLIRAPQGEGLVQLEKAGGVLMKSVVSYRTASVTNIAEAEKMAAASDGLIVWDLSHATGVLALDMAPAKLATGCTYKYLNGGPGAPAFIYARQDIANSLNTPLPGWMGHKSPFAFSSQYTPADGVDRFANGTPPILSLTALDGALNVFEGIDLADLEHKATRLGDLCLHLAGQIGLATSSPDIGQRRGGHVTLHHEHGYPLMQALIAKGIVGDFRAPDAIRFGFSPLYVQYRDVWRAMHVLRHLLDTGEWDQPAFHARTKVT